MPANDITLTPRIFTDTGATPFGPVASIAFGGTTRDGIVELRGSAPVGTVLELYADAINKFTLQDSFTVTDGSWSLSSERVNYVSFSIPGGTGLLEGAHTLFVRAVTPTGATVTLDPVAVNIDSHVDLGSLQLLRQDGGAVIAGKTQEVNAFHVAGTVEANSVLGLYDSDARLLATTYLSGSSAQLSFNLATGALAEGSHTLTLAAWDAYGNRTARALAVTIDTIAPPLQLNALAAGTQAWAQELGFDDVTSARRLMLAGETEQGATLGFFNHGVKIGELKNATPYWEFALPTLDYGSADLQVIATDAAGNATASAHLHPLITPYAGTGKADKFSGSKNADTLVGGGGADTLAGGNGDDVIHVSGLDFASVDGGRGSDTLVFDGLAQGPLDLRTVAARITGIENFDFRDGQAQSVSLDNVSLFRMTGSTAADTIVHVDGDAGDLLTLSATSGSWTQVANPAGEEGSARTYRASFVLDQLPLHPTLTALVVIGNPDLHVTLA